MRLNENEVFLCAVIGLERIKGEISRDIFVGDIIIDRNMSRVASIVMAIKILASYFN